MKQKNIFRLSFYAIAVVFALGVNSIYQLSVNLKSHCKMDLLLIAQDSNSISDQEFHQIKSGIKFIYRYLTKQHSGDGSRISTMFFSTVPQLVVNFDQPEAFSYDLVESRLNAYPKQNGDSCTEKALGYAASKVLKPKINNPSAKKVTLLILKEVSDCEGLEIVRTASQLVRETGSILSIISIGNSKNFQELRQMATTPELAIKIKKTDGLIAHFEKIFLNLCNVMKDNGVSSAAVENLPKNPMAEEPFGDSEENPNSELAEQPGHGMNTNNNNHASHKPHNPIPSSPNDNAGPNDENSNSNDTPMNMDKKQLSQLVKRLTKELEKQKNQGKQGNQEDDEIFDKPADPEASEMNSNSNTNENDSSDFNNNMPVSDGNRPSHPKPKTPSASPDKDSTEETSNDSNNENTENNNSPTKPKNKPGKPKKAPKNNEKDNSKPNSTDGPKENTNNTAEENTPKNPKENDKAGNESEKPSSPTENGNTDSTPNKEGSGNNDKNDSTSNNGVSDKKPKSGKNAPNKPSSTTENDKPSSTNEKDKPSSTTEKDKPSSTNENDKPSSTNEKNKPSSTNEKDKPSSTTENGSPASENGNDETFEEDKEKDPSKSGENGDKPVNGQNPDDDTNKKSCELYGVDANGQKCKFPIKVELPPSKAVIYSPFAKKLLNDPMCDNLPPLRNVGCSSSFGENQYPEYFYPAEDGYQYAIVKHPDPVCNCAKAAHEDESPAFGMTGKGNCLLVDKRNSIPFSLINQNIRHCEDVHRICKRSGSSCAPAQDIIYVYSRGYDY